MTSPHRTTNPASAGERAVTVTSTTRPTTHRLSPIVETPAEPGGLDGFEIRCTCGEVAGFSIRSMTAKHGRDHLAYFERQGEEVTR
jgi:hypothetical protein